MREFFLTASAWQIVIAGTVFFAGIYLIYGCLTWLLTERLLPAWGIGRKLDPRPLTKGQWQREIGLSLLSILIFGVGLLLPWGLLRLGWVNLALEPSPVQVILETLVLLLWNEVHFYITHRLLHTPWLRQFHLAHHRSVVTTPWSTYSFHPVEAMLLGNVIVWPMWVHDFSIAALITLPLLSLLFNSIGHSNYDVYPQGTSPWFQASRRHHLHHACFKGNFGFMFAFMDRLLGTSLPDDAAALQLEKWHARQS